MIPRQARLVRRSLVGALVLLAGAIAFGLRKPAPTPAGVTDGATAPAGQGPRFEKYVLRMFRDGREHVVKAESSLGQGAEGVRLRGVEATLPRVYQGKPATTTISAAEAAIDQERQKARFKGNVHVVTSEGLEFWSESLIYDGKQQRGRSDERVRFSKGDFSGEATGAEYDGTTEQLELRADVTLVSAREGHPPLEVRAGHAWGEQQTQRVRLEGGAHLTQGSDSLEAATMTLDFADGFAYVSRLVAIDNVVLAAGGGSEAPGITGSFGGKGARRLRCRKLHMNMGPGGALQEVIAAQNAELVVEPAAGGKERRTLKADVLAFRFADDKLVELSGGDKAFFSVEPVKGKSAVARTVHGQKLFATPDPGTGELSQVVFEDQVELVEPGRRATAGRALLDEKNGLLSLSLSPRVVDTEQGSDLKAQQIEIDQKSGGLTAKEGVEQVMAPRPKGGGLMGRQEVTQVTARFFEYDGKGRVGRYREGVALTSGADEIRSAAMAIEEPGPGHRRLVATDGVTSLLHPRTTGKERRPQKPVATRSSTMVYDEAAGTVVYSKEVVIRQEDIETRSPEATLYLSKDGSQMEKLVAGEPVEIVQGTRKATGRRGTYLPGEGKLVIIGEPARLDSPTERLAGPIITFFVEDERAKAEGEEEERTESVFKQGASKSHGGLGSKPKGTKP
jgi:lipopolysaccharide transport protein LptA